MPPDQRPRITSAEFSAVAAVLKAMTGIHLGPNKSAMVASRLSKRLVATGAKSVQAYLEHVQDARGAAEAEAFISALTTNMTRFHREEAHFEHFNAKVLPALAKAAQGGARVRIWSAGCSTGEEAYDLAFHVLLACPQAARYDLRILASDIDTAVLRKAQKGEYPLSVLDRLPAEIQQRFFEPSHDAPGITRVTKEVRNLIAFRRLNLDADWPFTGKFDIIMCRNVAIYLDAETQSRLWHRLVARLCDGGVLYHGHSEALPAALIDKAQNEGTGVYRFSASERTQHGNGPRGDAVMEARQ